LIASLGLAAFHETRAMARCWTCKLEVLCVRVAGGVVGVIGGNRPTKNACGAAGKVVSKAG